MKPQLDSLLAQIYETDARYRTDAYEFVLEALSFTQKKFRRTKHVTGEELLQGIKELLMERFGPMALTVLKYWRIYATEDFGYIVFNLVEKRVLSKTEEDDIEGFRNKYSFEEVFEKGYRNQLAKKISRMR